MSAPRTLPIARARWTPLAVWGMRLALAGIYLFAAIPKIADPWSFARAIHNFRILPAPSIPAVALALPVLEGLAALAVLCGILYRGGVAWLGLLSAAFAAGIASAMVRGLDIDCGCFGAAAKSSANWDHLLLNFATLAAAIILFLAAPRTPRKRRLPH